MKEYNFFKLQGAVRPTAEQLLDTKLYYQNSVEIYARFDDWKDDDRFYFIPLYMQMTYSCAGWVAEMAPDPVWLGSFVSAVLNHPELFQYNCPVCGKRIFPYRTVGSPLSGRVDLEGSCECGWHGAESVSGWKVRAIALRDQIEADKFRHGKYSLLHSRTKPATVQELIDWLANNHVHTVWSGADHFLRAYYAKENASGRRDGGAMATKAVLKHFMELGE